MSNIVLIGFMGTGKTEVGKNLAERLGYSFLDTDDLIEKTEKKRISQIFDKKGEEYFRNLETEVIKTLQDYDKFVIATGGGIVLKDENIKLLKQIGSLVLLSAAPEIVLKRLENDNTRPLLKSENKEEKIKEMLSIREPIYNNAADFKVDTSDKDVKTIIEEILSYVQNKS